MIQSLAPLLAGSSISQSSNPHVAGFVPRSAIEAQCANAFVAADVNRNGLIDWMELRHALCTGFPQWATLFTRNLAQQMLRSFDGDGNMELDWIEFCELFAFICQVNEEYGRLQRFDTPHDFTQRSRCTAYKVRIALGQMLPTIEAHYVNVMLNNLIPDCAANSPEESREIPLSSYMGFRSEINLILKTFDRLPKDAAGNAVVTKNNMVSLFCEWWQMAGGWSLVATAHTLSPHPTLLPPCTPPPDYLRAERAATPCSRWAHTTSI